MSEEYTGHVPCKKCGRTHWMHGPCELAAAGGSEAWTHQAEIEATHPMKDGATEQTFAADALAMQLVGERHNKRDLVNLVRWLILRKPDGLLSNTEPTHSERKHDRTK